MTTKSITVRIPTDIYEYLSARSVNEHRTISNMIISILMDSKDSYGIKDFDDTNICAVYPSDCESNAPSNTVVHPGIYGNNGEIVNQFGK